MKENFQSSKKFSWINLLIAIVIPLLAGALGSLLGGNFDSYQTLNQPPFAPPSAAFPIVWVILYIMMGFASYLVWQSGTSGTKTALTFYMIQLVFNVLWSLFFFRLETRLFAFIWLIALFVLVLITTVLFWRISKLAGLLMVPYLLWLIFAGVLNWSVYQLNK